MNTTTLIISITTIIITTNNTNNYYNSNLFHHIDIAPFYKYGKTTTKQIKWCCKLWGHV